MHYHNGSRSVASVSPGARSVHAQRAQKSFWDRELSTETAILVITLTLVVLVGVAFGGR